MKILLLGADGQLGRSISDYAINTDCEYVLSGRKDIDVTDTVSLEKKIMTHNPDVIIFERSCEC